MEDLFEERDARRRRENMRKLREREEKLRKVKIGMCMGAVGVIVLTLTAWCVFGGKKDSDSNKDRAAMADATIDKDSYGNTNIELDINGGSSGNDSGNNSGNNSGEGSSGKKYGYGDEVCSDNQLIVCIDAGHGGSDTGCIAKDGSKESEDDLKLALLVQHQLQQMGVKVVMTRSTDVWVDLEDRPYIANMSSVDLLISIHRNADEESDASGIEAWISHKENDNSYEIASLILNNLENVGISRNRGVRAGSMTSSEDDYVVNGKSSMPSVLLEMGFMSSPTDNRLFKNNLADYAIAIAQAVLQWSESQPY